MSDTNKYPNTELFEKLAEIEHTRWCGWQKYLHSLLTKETRVENGKEFETGNMVISKKSFERWEKQIKTPYSELSEKEKDSDREQVMSYFHLIKKA